MSLPAATANANTQAAVTAIQTAADTNFIAAVDSQILTAINLGSYTVTAMTNQGVNLLTIFTYYTGLGYQVTFPDFLQQNGAAIPSLVQQPVNFFGYNWITFWQNSIIAFGITNPSRMTIAWF